MAPPPGQPLFSKQMPVSLGFFAGIKHDDNAATIESPNE
jgi:hypothetical protein